MDYNKAYQQSLRLLNIRFLSEGELRKKLNDRDVPEHTIDQVIEQLKQEHFIDDVRLAQGVYRYFSGKQQYGHLYICSRLQRRFLPVPDNVERVDEYAVAARLVTKKFPDENVDSRKIIRFLQYRGFSFAVISEVLNNRT